MTTIRPLKVHLKNNLNPTQRNVYSPKQRSCLINSAILTLKYSDSHNLYQTQMKSQSGANNLR